ncbi:MAG: hypothetical protein ABSG68_07090 [Thermoguttaceae bacterium]
MRTSIILAVFAILGLGGQPAGANDNVGGPACCAQCGRHVACVQKTCQVVCDVQKDTRTSWSVECQEFCPLMPGCHDRCDCCPPPPRCGQPKCVKKLIKHEEQVDVPVYKCVVRYLCPACAGQESANSGSKTPAVATGKAEPSLSPPAAIPTPAPRRYPY